MLKKQTRLTLLAPLLAMGAMALSAAPASAYVYWDNLGTHTIARANNDGTGTNASLMATGYTGNGQPVGVAVDGSHLYWDNQASQQIGRANLDGTNPDPYFISGGTYDPYQIAISGSAILWATFNGQNVDSAPLAGGSVTHVIPGVRSVGTVADGSHIYWGSPWSGGIGRANLDGSGADPNFITGHSAGQMAVDDAYVYWVDSGTINRANKSNGSPAPGAGQTGSTLITGASGPQAVAVDGSHVYWTNTSSSAIGRANLDGSGVDQSFITAVAGVSAPIGIAVDGLGVRPTRADQCKNDGWKSYGTLFKNQGDCVSYVATKGKNQPSGA